MDIQAITNDGIVHKQVFRGHAPEQDNAVSISYPGTEVVGHGSFGVVFTHAD